MQDHLPLLLHLPEFLSTVLIMITLTILIIVVLFLPVSPVRLLLQNNRLSTGFFLFMPVPSLPPFQLPSSETSDNPLSLSLCPPKRSPHPLPFILLILPSSASSPC